MKSISVIDSHTGAGSELGSGAIAELLDGELPSHDLTLLSPHRFA